MPTDIDRALVVVAHPDDADFGCAGTVAGWVDEGIEVTYCVVTDGDAGGFDPTVSRAEVTALRRAEQTAAAKEVGVDDIIWLGYPDGQVTVTLPLRRDIAGAIRQVRPERVVCPWPARDFSFVFSSHPDHMAVGEATLCAVYPDARNPFAFPELAEEGLAAHIVDEVWTMGATDPDVYVDITDTFDRKMAALGRHVSQISDFEELAGFLRQRLEATGRAGGLAPGRLAEVFRRIDTSEPRRSNERRSNA